MTPDTEGIALNGSNGNHQRVEGDSAFLLYAAISNWSLTSSKFVGASKVTENACKCALVCSGNFSEGNPGIFLFKKLRNHMTYMLDKLGGRQLRDSGYAGSCI